MFYPIERRTFIMKNDDFKPFVRACIVELY